MKIDISRDEELDLTRLTVTGQPTLSEMLKALDWLSENRTRLILWDMSNADMSNAATSEVRKFVERAVELGKGRTDGRTAVVAPGDLEFGFARMSGSLTDMNEADYSLSAFRSIEDAMEWLCP